MATTTPRLFDEGALTDALSSGDLARAQTLAEQATISDLVSLLGRRPSHQQAVLFRLAEMATKVEAAHAMTVRAATGKDRGERGDVEAGMAKYLASEYCSEVVEASFRIHGGYGYSTEYEIERLYREAAFLLIGEGTSEIQKMIIGRNLLHEYAQD